MISWAMCTTFFLFISSSCWKIRNTNSEETPPKGANTSTVQRSLTASLQTTITGLIPLSLSLKWAATALSPSSCWPDCLLLDGNGGGCLSDLNWTATLAPGSPYWLFWSLSLWYASVPGGVTHGCWQYGGEGHKGRTLNQGAIPEPAAPPTTTSVFLEADRRNVHSLQRAWTCQAAAAADLSHEM